MPKKNNRTPQACIHLHNPPVPRPGTLAAPDQSPTPQIRETNPISATANQRRTKKRKTNPIRVYQVSNHPQKMRNEPNSHTPRVQPPPVLAKRTLKANARHRRASTYLTPVFQPGSSRTQNTQNKPNPSPAPHFLLSPIYFRLSRGQQPAPPNFAPPRPPCPAAKNAKQTQFHPRRTRGGRKNAKRTQFHPAGEPKNTKRTQSHHGPHKHCSKIGDSLEHKNAKSLCSKALRFFWSMARQCMRNRCYVDTQGRLFGGAPCRLSQCWGVSWMASALLFTAFQYWRSS